MTEVRIANAKKLFETNHSIAKVCFDVGFESIPSFISLFKKNVGVTPKEYIKQLIEQQKLQEKSPLAFIPFCFAENYNWNK